MKTKQLIKNLKNAISQDYLYSGEELEYMQEQLKLLESSVKKKIRMKPEGFGKK